MRVAVVVVVVVVVVGDKILGSIARAVRFLRSNLALFVGCLYLIRLLTIKNGKEEEVMQFLSY